MTTPCARPGVRAVLAFAMALVGFGAPAHAAIYPANKCVSDKQKEMGKYCAQVLKAWAAWEKTQDDAERDGTIQEAAGKLSSKWGTAETKAFAKGVDCGDAALTAVEALALVDAAIQDVVNGVNDGLDLGDADHAKCGQKLLGAAAKTCQQLLTAESGYIKSLERDPDGVKRDDKKGIASEKFADQWQKATAGGCPTTATEAGIAAVVAGISDAAVAKTVVAVNLDDTQFTLISPTGTTAYQGRNFTPVCVFGTPYHYWVRRGSVNKLLMYYQGGGACWEQLTCAVPVCDSAVNPTGSDNLNASATGFFDLGNPDNPFRDWNIVFVSYCSCDIHFGDAAQDYDNLTPGTPLHVEHRGFHNAKVAEKYAREHFLNPEIVFVTGTSAGGYGALFQGGVLQEVWPASQFHVLGDASNGVITASFLQNEFNNWNFRANLPPDVPGVLEAIDDGTGMVGYIDAVSNFFPQSNWAHYATAYDGGSGGQSGFYNVMLNGNDPIAGLSWWQASCQFNEVMRQQVAENVTLAPGNYRYYIGSGSRHGMWFHNKVYSDTTGGVPLIVDWVTAMLNSGPGAPDTAWTNVEADPSNIVLPGACSASSDNADDPCNLDSQCPNGTCSGEDVHPEPLQPPFESSGGGVIVNCPP